MSGHRRVISAESCASNLVLLAKPSDGPSHQGSGGHPAPPDQARSIQKTPSHLSATLPPKTGHATCSQSAHDPRGPGISQALGVALGNSPGFTTGLPWARHEQQGDLGVKESIALSQYSSQSGRQERQVPVSNVSTCAHTHTHTHTRTSPRGPAEFQACQGRGQSPTQLISKGFQGGNPPSLTRQHLIHLTYNYTRSHIHISSSCH